MKRIIIPAFALILLASCAEKNDQESNQGLTQKTETIQKEDKQKIEQLLNQYKNSWTLFC